MVGAADSGAGDRLVESLSTSMASTSSEMGDTRGGGNLLSACLGGANHCIGSAALPSCFLPLVLAAPLLDECECGSFLVISSLKMLPPDMSDTSLLTSRPNRRAELVKARGRPSTGLDGGHGEMSMAEGPSSVSGVKTKLSRGGEFSDTFEANDDSRSMSTSDDRKSLSSFLRRVLWDEKAGRARKFGMSSLARLKGFLRGEDESMIDERREKESGGSRDVYMC
jgi:hypothetical protein